MLGCNDTDQRISDTELATATTAAAGKAPTFGSFLVAVAALCKLWPAPETPLGPLHGTGAPPVLVIGGVDDPVAPFTGVQAVAGQLGSAVLVNYSGLGPRRLPAQRLHRRACGPVPAGRHAAGAGDAVRPMTGEPTDGRGIGDRPPSAAISSLGGMTYSVDKTDEQWRAELSPAEYSVLRQAATERPYTGQYNDTTTPGTYYCRACGADLFTSNEKFASHCGWPSFYAPSAGDNVELDRGPGARHGPHRGQVRVLRLAPRARVRGRGLPHSHGPAVLHQLRRAAAGSGAQGLSCERRSLRPCRTSSPAQPPVRRGSGIVPALRRCRVVT